jgi:putative endonuclease
MLSGGVPERLNGAALKAASLRDRARGFESLLLRHSRAAHMFYVYVLRSERTGKRYVGSSSDIATRLEQHNRGKVRATKGGRPWKLAYQEEYETNGEARRRELALKSGQGRAERDRMLGRGGSAP